MDSNSDEQITEEHERENKEQKDKVTVPTNKTSNNENNNSEYGKNDNPPKNSGNCHSTERMSIDKDDDNCTNENVLTEETTTSTLTCAERRKKMKQEIQWVNLRKGRKFSKDIRNYNKT